MASVFMYTKTFCPYCERARELLRSKGVAWEEVNLEQEPKRREEMIARSGRETVPQIWIGERHIGGSDELVALEGRGQLEPLLRA